MLKQIEIHGHIFNSFRSEGGFSPSVAIAELIDNAIDAGATTVEIQFDSAADTITIIDDGRGCEDMARFFDLGNTSALGAASRIGRYGVGGTKAVANLCDVEFVTSICNGIKRSASIDWTRIAENNLLPQYEEDALEHTTAPSGTLITLLGDRRRCALRQRHGRIVEYCSGVYTPALLAGTRIVFDGSPLKARPFPKLIHARSVNGTIGKKHYRAHVGVLADEVAARSAGWDPGFWVACGPRMLSSKSDWDLAEEWGDSPFWAYIELIETPSSKWDLETHKGGFSEREDLFSDFVPQVLDLLELAHEQQTDVEIRVVEEDASSVMAAVFNGTSGLDRIREKRNARQNSTGAVEPKDTGRERTNAEKVDPKHCGSVIDFPGKARKDDQSWKLKFSRMGEDRGLGEPRITRHCAWMTFNLDNAFVAVHRRDLDILIPLAISCIWAEANSDERSRLWGKLIKSGSEIESGNPTRGSSEWLGAAMVKVSEQLAAMKSKARKAS